MATATAHDAHDAHDHPTPTGWRRFVYSTNHKDIGTMYLVFAIVGGVIGGALSICMRIELMYPGMQFFHGEHASHLYNVFTTAHGDHDLLHGDAGDDRRLRQLDRAADDRSARH